VNKPCPVCGWSIPSRQLAGQPRRRPYRICPRCDAHIIVDPLTKRRHVVALVLGLIALTLAVAATVSGAAWSVTGTVISSVMLVAWIAYSEQRVRFVRHEG
jgi:hypothetical protein